MRKMRMSVSSRRSVSTGPVREQRVRYPVTDDGFAELIEEMRLRAGLTPHAIAGIWGVSPNAVYQYFHKKRGRGGTSTLRWFLRFAEVCGCEVTVTFPQPVRGEPRVVLMYGQTADADGGGGLRADGHLGGADR